MIPKFLSEVVEHLLNTGHQVPLHSILARTPYFVNRQIYETGLPPPPTTSIEM